METVPPNTFAKKQMPNKSQWYPVILFSSVNSKVSSVLYKNENYINILQVMIVKNRYFIAIVLPQPYYDQATELKIHFKDHFRSKASLNSPPHITLHMPFEWRSDRENDLIQTLEKFSAKLSPAEVKLENFNCFEPRVIFINVFHSKELNDLQHQLRQFCKRELGLFNADYKDLPFHPHVTLAFRDLRKPEFIKAWEEFRTGKFEGAFLATQICLLKHEDGKWNVFRELDLQSVS